MEIGRNPSLFLRLSQGADQVLDSASLQTMVERLCESGKILKAYKLLRQLANSGASTGEDALHVFHQMERNSVSPNLAVYTILMKCYCRKRKWILAFSLWMKYMRGLPDYNNERLKLMEKNVDLGNIEVAVRGVLEIDMKCKVVESSLYNIFLTGLCQAGMLDQALKIFNVLEECKVSVTPPSCVYLVNCLCHEKKVDLALNVFLYTLEMGVRLMMHAEAEDEDAGDEVVEVEAPTNIKTTKPINPEAITTDPELIQVGHDLAEVDAAIDH
ncbi:hypothetical protein IFM89_031581 [Coptis chinensis]|uniref:Pentatricopeptide repeat-containing protein n=1 Tax=Coptis chinensis TaxID=261450 RepID=A0A835LS33_9MAGN|nr:hypothetical protein IFM89_031581 [Coptis chinensis]